MAAPSGKKKVDLRQLMKQKKAAKQDASKKINSPLAKYNNLGQLICVVCNQPVKSEILWNAHIQGKKHKDNVVLLKTGKPAGGAAVSHPARSQSQPRAQPSSAAAAVKRKAEPSTAIQQPIKGILKKPRIGLPYGDSSSDESSDESDSETRQNNLPADFFDNAKASSSTSSKRATSNSSASQATRVPGDGAPAGLPADFFDNSVSSSSSLSMSHPANPSSRSGTDLPSSTTTDSKQDQDQASKPMSEVLPEGFFDDPVKDAKVRKVEVRNTMEEEWEKFTKEMETQHQVSETLAEEDDEAAQAERNIDQIDEQIQCFAKVETLWDKQDELKTKVEERRKEGDQGEGQMEEDEGGDEAEFEEFLNWRSKGAWK